MSWLTYSDTVDRLVRYLGGNPEASVIADCKDAALEALRTFSNAHNWSYLYSYSRILTSEPYSTGTIAVDVTGGTYERQVTLTGGVWPEWTGDGTIRIGNINHRVQSRKSATVATLEESQTPSSDVASTQYTLYRDTYLLPDDFVSQDATFIPNNFAGLTYHHPREWFARTELRQTVGTPRVYSIMGDPHYSGRLVFRVAPFPDAEWDIEFVYKRRPRLLLIYRETGRATTTADSTSVVGVNTSFTTDMIGSVIRFASNTTLPTAASGSNPFVFESLIQDVTDGTHLTLADAAPSLLSQVSYVISDPVDIERGSMESAYLRCCEMHLGMSRTLKDKPSARSQYLEALERAKSADSRSFTGRTAGVMTRMRLRLRDYPINLTEDP